MATLKQIEANRRNAQKSSGPRTEAGKAVSRLNALKTGIDAVLSVVKDENPDSLAQLTESFYRDHQPANATECAILDGIIRDTWLLRRFFHIEAELLEWEIETDLYKDKTENKVGKAFHLSSTDQIRLQRRIDATRKSQMAGIKELERLQAERRAQPQPQQPAEPLDVTTSFQTPTTQIGFVPHTTPEHPDPVPAPATEASLTPVHTH